MIIAICEDNEQDMVYLLEQLQYLTNRKDIQTEFVTFSSGEDMIEYMKLNGTAQISFLDVFMGGLSGVEAAQWIRERSDSAALVFTTSSPDYMASGWQVGAAHYLLKPFSPESIEQALSRCLKQVAYQRNYVEVVSNRAKRKIVLGQVMYAESQNKYCIIHLADGQCVNTLMRLDELEELMADQRFFRCHQSYLVNMDKIEKVAGTELVLVGGMRLPIRRGSRAEVVTRYEDYFIDKTRRRP